MDFKLGRSFGLMLKTLPFIGLRTFVYLSCSVIFLTGLIGGPALAVWAAPTDVEVLAFWGGLSGGITVASVIIYFLREYFLYIVKAGHLAVLVELHEGRPLPKGQLAYGKDKIAEKFLAANVFFAVDQVIKGILKVADRLMFGIGSFIPGLDSVMGFIRLVINTSLTFADEVILALVFRTRTDDVWRTSRDGIILYAQNFKRILKNAFFLAIVNYVLLALFFVLAWGPASALAHLADSSGGAFLTFVATLVVVWSLKKAFIEPFLMTCLMQVYFKCIEGQTPNPEWKGKLEKASSKFKGMVENFTSSDDEAPAPVAAQSAPQGQLEYVAPLPQAKVHHGAAGEAQAWQVQATPQHAHHHQQQAWSAQQQQAWHAQQQAHAAQQQQQAWQQQQQAWQQQQAHAAQQQQQQQAWQQQQAHAAQQQQAWQQQQAHAAQQQQHAGQQQQHPPAHAQWQQQQQHAGQQQQHPPAHAQWQAAHAAPQPQAAPPAQVGPARTLLMGQVHRGMLPNHE